MRQQNNVRGAETLGVEMGRELADDELAAICGGANPGNLGFGDFSDMGNLLGSAMPSAAKAPSASKAGGSPSSAPGLGGGLGSLSNLAGGLLGGLL